MHAVATEQESSLLFRHFAFVVVVVVDVAAAVVASLVALLIARSEANANRDLVLATQLTQAVLARR